MVKATRGRDLTLFGSGVSFTHASSARIFAIDEFVRAMSVSHLGNRQPKGLKRLLCRVKLTET